MREANRILAARLDNNDFPAFEPQEGVRYIAHGVRPDGPAPVPHECTSWRHMLLHHRICEIRDAEYKAASSIWENGVMVRELPFDGAAVDRLVNDVIEHFEADDLDRAERRCEMAERAMVARRPMMEGNNVL